MATTWLITRELEDAQEVREARSILVPCVETKLLPWPWPLSVEVQHLTLFTSRRTVAAWIAAGRPQLGLSAALRPSTSKTLEREGVTPDITSETGVVGLAERVEDWWIKQGRPALHIRYPTSDAGLQSAEQREAVQLLATLGSVDRRIAYVVTAPPLLRETLERVTQEDWSISFASPSAIMNFFAAHAAIPRPPTQVACRGASTERAWNETRPDSWPAAITPHPGKSPS